MAEKKIPKISIGITSLTVILCVLCLTVFSVLALSTALSERNFSEKRAMATQDYYAAETEAAALVNTLQEAWKNGENLYAFFEKNEILTEGDIFHFYKSIDEGQKLYVELCLSDGFEIKKWQVVSMADWAPDESLHVWDGELLFTE
mgnify:CR=1 FL=1